MSDFFLGFLSYFLWAEIVRPIIAAAYRAWSKE
jgi:hypothetical protein